MRRYKGTKRSIDDATGKLKYDTTLYQTIPDRDGDLFIITQDGDRLDNLAYRFYKDSSLWWYIANANNIQTMNVESGLQLRIPVSLSNAKGF
jgi:hypothetical protein